MTEPMTEKAKLPGHIEMQHLATPMFQHDEHEQHLHGDRRNRKEVDGHTLT